MSQERRLRGIKWLIVVAGLAIMVGACGNSEGETEPPATTTSPFAASAAAWPTGGWPVSTPEEQGMDSGVLADLVEFVAAIDGIDSVTVVRNGYAVLDTVVYPFPEDTGHIIHSATKSITGTLIGIAIDRGLLEGVQVPVVEILAEAAPETVDELKASMTVEHLLTMSTGLDCSDPDTSMAEMMASDDWTAYLLALPMVEEPGTRFQYCDGASHLLSAVLTEVTETSAAEFAEEVLFEPLGITDYVWPADPDGISTGWGEMVLHPADMAKIGYLYLRGGAWDGDQVVPQEWVEAATTAQIAVEPYSDGYGYQWWVDDAGYVMAIGIGGQYIMVVPDRDLVVVFTSGLPLRGQNYRQPESLMNEYVLPAVIFSDPLPPNHEGEARLAESVEAARSAPEAAPVDLPETASIVDGADYEFRPNDFGNRSFVLSFTDDSASLRLANDWPLNPLRYTDTGQPFDIEIGLDGRFVTTDVWGQPIAARGAWPDDNTFLIEFQHIHLIGRGTFEFVFSDDVASLEFRELVGGINQWSEADRAG